MTVKFTMENLPKELEKKRTTFPRPSAGFPLDNYDETHPQFVEDEERGTYMGMTESEFFGGDVGDK